MANIRIKDLANIAGSSASDDFLALDGSANGTRKLNAFSPTFGGNATVGGTLTVNGAGSFTSSNSQYLSVTSSGTSQNSALKTSDGTTTWYTGILGGTETTDGSWRIYDTTTRLKIDKTTGNVSIAATTASTTTSTGALVVGNGTSGGLGVGGSANIQGNLTLGYASSGDSVLKVIRSFGGNEWLQIAGWSAGSLGNNAYSIDAVNGASARPVYFRRSTDAGSTYTNFLTWDTSNNATFGGTVTSTTSTDSGVLQLNLVNSSTGTSASSLFRFNAGTRTATLQAYNDTHATLAGQLRVGTSNGDIVVIPSGVTAATFGASSISFGALNYTNTITGGDSGAGTSIVQFRDGLGNTKINFKGDGAVALSNATASTSTSSGALVVSGGVGVAKEMYLGGGLLNVSKSGAGSTVEVNADSGYDSKISLQRAATNRWTIECDTSDTLRFKSLGSTQVVAVTSSNLTFSGDLLFFANSTYDIGTTSNRVRQIFVRDIYSTFYTPASATDTGTAGRICYDSNYIYICTATNTWKRAAISTW